MFRFDGEQMQPPLPLRQVVAPRSEPATLGACSVTEVHRRCPLYPDSGHHRKPWSVRSSAVTRFMHRSKQKRYSIISSARASSDGGISRPSALAVLRLMTSSYLVGACTGRSAGFSPLRMRST